MNSPSVTVLLTVWNGMPYLRQAVDSILVQTEKKFTFLILNNGSEDGTKEYLSSLSDPRLVIEHLPENIGRTAVLNKGLAMVRTEYTAVIDADDVAEPARLEKQLAYLVANPDTALVGSNVLYIDRSGAVAGEDRFPTDHARLRDNLPLHNQFAHAACTYKTAAALEAGGYPAKFPYAQDLALWLAMLALGYRAASIDEFLARIRVHPGQATRNLQLLMTRRADNHRLARLMLSIPGMAPASRQAAMMRSAGALWGLGQKKEAAAACLRAFALAPPGFFTNPIMWRRILLTVRRRLFPIRA